MEKPLRVLIVEDSEDDALLAVRSLRKSGYDTTYERVEEFMPLVVKKDGRREPFNRTKVVEGLKKACEKRPISINLIEEFVDGLEKTLQECILLEVVTN